MARTKRQLMVALMMTALVAAGRPVLAGGADFNGMSRVRSSSASILALIGQAAERSETFRRLVETIDASDGIVYVEEGTCGRGVRACFVAVSESGPNSPPARDRRYAQGRVGSDGIDRSRAATHR